MTNHPHFSPIYGGFAALRAAASGSWEWSGKQHRDGKRLIQVVVTPRQRHRGHLAERGRRRARARARARGEGVCVRARARGEGVGSAARALSRAPRFAGAQKPSAGEAMA